MAGIRADIDLSVNTQGVKRSLDRATNEINKVVNKISGKNVGFSVNEKSFTQPLGRINASANEFTKSLEASNARVIAFGASVAILDGISNAFKSLVTEAVAFEKTLADINAVLSLSNSQIRSFGEGLFDAARNTAQGFNIAAEAALEFSRQGLSTEEVIKRTNDALILTRLTSLKAADAVAGLTAAVNAFGDAGLTTTDIIDKLSAVDVNFAVSSEDLINALQRAGAVAIDAGVEFDSLVGIVAALQQTTARGGAVIGNSLKTIFTRIQRPEALNQLEQMGIVVRDLSGAILPADKVLLNMSKTFDSLTQSQQSNVVQFSAGIFQANVFRAALKDLSKENSLHAQATKISADAAGEAARKNELLNKTVSALASQAGTNLQELAATIGQLAIGPQMADALEFVNERIEEIRGALGGGEEEGSTFGKGLVRGIGNVISGPAAIAFGAIFIKLFMNIAKFASNSMKDVLGVVSQKDRIKQMEDSIVDALSRNHNIQQSLNNLEGDRLAQEKFMLGIIEAQTDAMEQQRRIAQSLAGPLVAKGVSPDLGASGGLVPEASRRKERKGAAMGGYGAGPIDSMRVQGVGDVVYNKAETVKQFPGMKQPAIMPPENSRAGSVYQKAFQGKHGFDPYASDGFVPNFATAMGKNLVMDKSKLTLFGGSMDIARATGVNYKEIEKLFASRQPVKMSASLKDIIMSSDGGKQKISGKETLFEAFSALSGAGIDSIERTFNVRPPIPGGKGKGKLSRDQFAERKSLNLLNKEVGGNQLTYDPKTKKGVQNYPVDIIGPGGAHEVKSGKLSAANIISKSLRMASDRELSGWMSANKISGGKGLKGKNLSGAQKLAGKMGIKGSGKGGEFSESDADMWGMSEGFVPNFKKDWNSLYNDLIKKYEAGQIKTPKNIYKDVFGMSGPSFLNYLKEQTRTQTVKGKKYNTRQSGMRKALGDKKFNNAKKIYNEVKDRTGHLSDVRIKGDLFEEVFSMLAGQPFKKGTDALDFSEARGRRIRVPRELRKKIGLQDSIIYGDTESGTGHGAKLMRTKVLRELADQGKLGQILSQSGKVELPGSRFVDIIAEGADARPKKNLTTTLGDIRSKSKPLTKQAIDQSIKSKKELNKKISYDYHVDDIDLNKLTFQDINKYLSKQDADLIKRKTGKFSDIQSKFNNQGFVPNFHYWQKFLKWSKGPNGWGLRGDDFTLTDFANYLQNHTDTKPQEIAKINKQTQGFKARANKDLKGLGGPSMGREGAKHYASKAAIQDRKGTIDLNGIFIKNLKDKVERYNSGRSLGSFSDASSGLVPNFADIVPFDNAVPFKKKTIKSKNLMHQEYLKEFAGGETQFRPGQTMLQFLSKFYDRKTLQDLKKYPEDYRILSGGFVPNFADPLAEAVEREKAAGIPASNIKIEQSNQLKGPGNPMGLAVTNTRDEPAGVGQGIRRAKSMGIDPKSHGAAGGFMPNFVVGGAAGGPAGQKFKDFENQVESTTNSLKDNEEGVDKHTTSNMEGLQRLFYLQSSISMASGFLQEFAETGGETTKTMAELGLGVSNVVSTMIATKEFASQLAEMGGVEKGKEVGLGGLLGKVTGGAGGAGKGKGLGLDKIAKTIGGIAKFGKGLLRLAPAVGQLITGFSVLNEVLKFAGIDIFDLFKDNADKAADKLEKLSESAEKTQSALDVANGLSSTRDKMSKLEIIGSGRTLKQEKELISLRIKEIKQQTSLQSKLAQVDIANLKNKDLINEINKAKSGEVKGTETLIRVLEKIAKQEAVQMAFATAIKDFGEKTEGEFGMFEGSSPSKELKDELNSLANRIAEITVGLDPKKKEAMKKNLEAGNIQGISGLESLDLETAEKKKFFINALNEQIKVSEREHKETKKAQQAKSGLLTEYTKIVANYKKQREEIIHQNKLDNIITQSKRKINSRLIDLQSEYEMMSRSTAIQNKSALDGATITEKLESDKLKANNEALNSLEAIRKKYVNITALSSQFNSDAKDAQTGVAELKNAIKKGLNPQMIAEVSDSLGGLDKGQIQDLNTFFKELGKEIKDHTDNQEIINKLVEKYGDNQDSILSMSVLLAKHHMKLTTILPENIEALKKTGDSLRRSQQTAETNAKVARAGLENEKALNLIKQKTVEGARELAMIFAEQKNPAESMLENLQGEVDTLAVINHFRKDSLKKIMESGALDDKAYEQQTAKNRTDAEAAVLSLKQLQVQENILRDTDEFKIIQIAKIQSEVLGASAAAKDAAFRNEYLSYNETRESLVQSQISEETTTLETTARNNLTKLKLLAGSEELRKQVDLQIQEEITSAQSSALVNSEKALILSAMGKQGELLRQANELQESSNKLIGLENAIRKAAVSEQELRLSVGTDIATERATGIRGTREAGMRATITGSPEDALAFSQSLEETNKQLQIGSRAFDRMRTKIAEMDVAAKNLGADLVDIGLDQTRSGMKQLFKDIGSGAKSAKEAWSDFGLGLADVLLDRMMEHNIDQIIKNLTFAFTGENALSEAEKMASSNNNLISENQKLVSSLDALRMSVEGQKRAVEGQVASRADIGVTKTGVNPNDISLSDPNTKRGAEIDAQAREDILHRQMEEQAKKEHLAELARQAKNAQERQRAEDIAANPDRSRFGLRDKDYDPNELASSDLKVENMPELEPGRQKREVERLIVEKENEFQRNKKFLQKANYDPEFGTLEKKYAATNPHTDEGKSLKVAMDGVDATKTANVQLATEINQLKSNLKKINMELIKRGRASELTQQEISSLTSSIVSAGQQIDIVTQNLKNANQQNFSSYKPFNEITIPAAKPRTDFFGGKIQKFAKGGFVEGEPGVDKVPAMLTAGEFVVPKKAAKALKDGGILQHFEEGGVAQRVKAGATGLAQGFAMQEAARYVAKKMQDKDAHKDKPPEFDMNKFKNLNLDSTLSISRGDPRSSGKLLAKDPVMEEYRGHLLDVASYRAAQKNKDVSKRMSKIGSIVGTVASFAISQLTSLAAKPLNALIEKGKNVALGHSGIGKHSEAFKAARKAGLDNVNYKDIADSIESGKPLEYNGKLYGSDFASNAKGNEVSNFQFRARGGKKHGSWFESIKKTEANNPNYRGATAQDLQNKINSTQMEKVKMRPRSTEAITGIDRGKPLEVFSGGEIPAMLTAGESFIPAPIAKRIGYDNLNKMNRTGSIPIIDGPGGVDNVGPVGLSEGDFIIRRSSTDKLLRDNPNMMKFAMQNPDGFRKAEKGYYKGGIVGTASSPSSSISTPQTTSGSKPAPVVENRISSLLEGTQANQTETAATNQNTEVTNNINVNVTIDKSGNEKVSTEGAQGTYEQEQQLAMKIKTKVLEVIREEKRIGGELSG